jgi:hypothetical protein
MSIILWYRSAHLDVAEAARAGNNHAPVYPQVAKTPTDTFV